MRYAVCELEERRGVHLVTAYKNSKAYVCYIQWHGYAHRVGISHVFYARAEFTKIRAAKFRASQFLNWLGIL